MPRTQAPPRWTAKTADKYHLYELSVQETDADLDFVEGVYRERRGAEPLRFQEDFCGTALLCARWVQRGPRRTAVGVDLDAACLDYARGRHLARLKPEERRRVQLIQADVRRAETPPADVIGAFNFSYWGLRSRAELLDYFRHARESLAPEGCLVLDLFGGADAQVECEETTKKEGFTYIWKQEAMDAITNHITCRIAFRFPDKSVLEDAFVYHWRVWSLPEIRDVLHDAGFGTVTAYWEGVDEDGEGDGVFLPREHAENEEAWIAYLVAWKD